MDWSLFWAAFGAIGSTVGSLATAVAVIIAAKEYREPMVKRIKVVFGCAATFEIDHSDMCNVGTDIYYISVINIGVRTITLSNINICIGKKVIDISQGQFVYPNIAEKIVFPVELPPEKEVKICLERDNFSDFLAKRTGRYSFKAHESVRVLVIDRAGSAYYHKTGLTVKDFVYNKVDRVRFNL